MAREASAIRVDSVKTDKTPRPVAISFARAATGLKIEDYNMSAIAPDLGQSAPKVQIPAPIKTVTGQYISKAVHYSKADRAWEAALWLRGEATVKPTFQLAARVFHVSVSLVVDASHRLDEQREHGKRNGTGTAVLSDAVIENMVAEIGIDRVWRAVEKLTQPQFPLQAAE